MGGRKVITGFERHVIHSGYFRSDTPHADTVLTKLCRHVSFLLCAAVFVTVMNEIKFMDLVGYNTADKRGFSASS